MSSPMMPPSGGPPQGGRNMLKETQSPLNPGDAALMAKTGQASVKGTFGEFMEGSFGVKWEDPVPVALEKMKGAAVNASPMGKSKSMAAGAAPAGPSNQAPGMPARPMPQGRPMAAQGGLESLMGGR